MADSTSGKPTRRELLKNLSALPFTMIPFGKGEVLSVEHAGQLLIFVDDQAFDVVAIVESELDSPALRGSTWFPVKVPRDKSIEDVIRIYQVQDENIGR